MHEYDFRCKACHNRFTLSYKTYADYDAATPACLVCGGTDLARLITGVAIHQKPQQSYQAMSGEQLHTAIQNTDKPREMGQLFQQIGDNEPGVTQEFKDVTKRLLKGEQMTSIEKDIAIPDTYVPPDKSEIRKEREKLDKKINKEKKK